MTPEQRKIVARCARMLNIGMRGFKRVVFNLAPDGRLAAVDYEIHGKEVFAVEDDDCNVVDITES